MVDELHTVHHVLAQKNVKYIGCIHYTFIQSKQKHQQNDYYYNRNIHKEHVHYVRTIFYTALRFCRGFYPSAEGNALNGEVIQSWQERE